MNYLNCEKCGTEDFSSIYRIDKRRYCEKCAAEVFSNKLERLRKRFTKLSKQYRDLFNSKQEG